MNFKFIYIKTPNSVILNRELLQGTLNQPQLLKLFYPATLIISFLALLKIEIIEYMDALNTAKTHSLKPLIIIRYQKKR